MHETHNPPDELLPQSVRPDAQLPQDDSRQAMVSEENPDKNVGKVAVEKLLQNAASEFVRQEVDERTLARARREQRSLSRRHRSEAKPIRVTGVASESALLKLYLQDIGQYSLLDKDQEYELGSRMRVGRDATAKMVLDGFRSAFGLGPMYNEEEKEVTKLVDGFLARDIFIKSNLRLVVSIAKRYQSNNHSLMDLIQMGYEGLNHGVDKFDERRGFKFSTYISWWIKQRITRTINQNRGPVRIPTRSKDKSREVIESLNAGMSMKEVGQATGLSEATILAIVNIDQMYVSLDEQLGDDSAATRIDSIPDDRSQAAFEEADSLLEFKVLLPVLRDVLDKREFEILMLKYGVNTVDQRERTLAEIGKRFDITKERVRQIEARALIKLRHPSVANRLGNFPLSRQS